MARKLHAGNWKKGQSGNPRGKPPTLLPEVRKAIDQNKNALKVIILQEMNIIEDGIPKVQLAIRQIMDRCVIDGDALKLRILLEMALGKVVEDPEEFPVSIEEKELILKYREALDARKKDSGEIIEGSSEKIRLPE